MAEPNIVEPLDFEAILKAKRDDLVARYPDIAPIIDLESEPSRKLLEVFCYEDLLLRNRVNDAARQSNLYTYATGTTLDNHAAFHGLERMVGESDDRLRERIRLAILGWSKSGTAHYYRLQAMSASIDVADAIVWRDDPSPVVKIAIVSVTPGGVASPALLQTVAASLGDPRVRMVNDTLSVISAVQTTVNVSANIWLLPDAPADEVSRLATALVDAWNAKSRVGFNLAHSWIIATLMQGKVQRVQITAPTSDSVVGPHEAVAIGTVTLTFMGRDY